VVAPSCSASISMLALFRMLELVELQAPVEMPTQLEA
jgi:hypothetical protein